MAVNEDIPFTERSNPLTENLDSASASDIVRMLWSVDRELIQETYDGCPGVLSHQIVEELQKLGDLVHERLTKITSPRTYIVLSGCGSSGRFAYLAVRKFNRILKQNGFVPNFRYLLAGGDRALFVSIEASEDAILSFHSIALNTVQFSTAALYHFERVVLNSLRLLWLL